MWYDYRALELINLRKKNKLTAIYGNDCKQYVRIDRTEKDLILFVDYSKKNVVRDKLLFTQFFELVLKKDVYVSNFSMLESVIEWCNKRNVYSMQLLWNNTGYDNVYGTSAKEALAHLLEVVYSQFSIDKELPSNKNSLANAIVALKFFNNRTNNENKSIAYFFCTSNTVTSTSLPLSYM